MAEAALLLSALAWGGGFVAMKSALDYLPANWLLAVRFLLASLLLFCAMSRRVVRASRVTWIGAAVTGLVHYAAYAAQTIGLTTTTAGNNAFLTAVYVVIVPFMQWIFTKRRPALRVVLAAVLCLGGVGVIALQGGFYVATGDAWTLLCGVLYALTMLLVARSAAQGADMLALSCVQFGVMGLCALAAAGAFEPPPPFALLVSADVLRSLAYLVLASTVFALGAYNISLKYAPPAHASLIMSLEAPFGSLFGILLLGEKLTPRFALGALLIFTAILISELGLSAAGKKEK